jgi:hypothetical protein
MDKQFELIVNKKNRKRGTSEVLLLRVFAFPE